MDNMGLNFLKFLSTVHYRIVQFIAVVYGVISAIELLFPLVGVKHSVLWFSLVLSLAVFSFFQVRIDAIHTSIEEEHKRNSK